jgi:AcrR family transcriptional regulator
MPRESTRPRVLAAAYRIVRREGVAHLTIDAVAREAGLSKGGVLYHFPTKEALVEGMVAALVEDFEQHLALAYEREAPGPGRWLRAYIRVSSAPMGQDERGDTTSVIAALATYPELLAPLRRSYAAWQERAERDGLSPALATSLRLAADGLWLADLLGLAPPGGELRAAVIEQLLALTGALAGSGEATA